MDILRFNIFSLQTYAYKQDTIYDARVEKHEYLFHIFDCGAIYYSWFCFSSTGRDFWHKFVQKSTAPDKRLTTVEEILAVEWANGYMWRLQFQWLYDIITHPGSKRELSEAMHEIISNNDKIALEKEW